MKILFVVTGLYTKTGTYEVVRNTSKMLLQKHEVSLLTDVKSNIEIPFTKIIKLPLNKYGIWETIINCRKIKYNIIRSKNVKE